MLVTHDQGEALSLADQVAVMRDGRVVAGRRPRASSTAPRSTPASRRFVGGAAMLPAAVARRRRHAARSASSPSTGRARTATVQVLVRPEQLRCVDGPAATPARVDEVSFYGHDAAVRARPAAGRPAVVARVAGLDAPGVGTDGDVGVAGRVVVFATSDPLVRQG